VYNSWGESSTKDTLLMPASRANRFSGTRLVLAIGLGISVWWLTPQAKANSYWVYGCVQGMQQRYGSRFDQQRLQEYCQCRDKDKRSSEECHRYLGLSQSQESSKRFSSQEEFTIGVMTVVICAKRLGKIDDARGTEILISSLSKERFPLELAAKESLWLEAYKEVGSGLEWCRANQ
jgi:hypothetical protein